MKKILTSSKTMSKLAMLKKLFGRPKKPAVIARPRHTISRKNIHRFALKVLYRLRKNGYDAYLVGGSVRDLLLGATPKDFDIVTNARPEQVKRLFGNCSLIGKRFRLAHIYFKGYTIEVSTFRSKMQPNKYLSKEGMILKDNIYGTIEQDVWRRDFTINALYYNIKDFSVIDFVDGLKDLNHRIIRIIGKANKRYREDPVRMLRAIRFAAKLNMTIEKSTAVAIFKNGQLLRNVPSARLFFELFKLLSNGNATKIFEQLYHYNLLQYLLPATYQCLLENPKEVKNLLLTGLKDTDKRFIEQKYIATPFLFALLLWYPIIEEQKKLLQKKIPKLQAFNQAFHKILQQQTKVTAISKNLCALIYEILILQIHLDSRSLKQIKNISKKSRFRAAFDLLILRSLCQPKLKNTVSWWEKRLLDLQRSKTPPSD